MFLSINSLRFLFYSFPLFIFTSSFYLNLYCFIFITYSLFFFYLNKIRINMIRLDYLIILFFFSCAVSSFLNLNSLENFNIGGNKFKIEISAFAKSIFNFRFVILYIFVRNIIDKQLVNIKIFSIISLICSISLSLNIFLQHLIGFDIFNNKPFDGRFNSFFEHEAIAGSYIQKFFLISIFFLFLLKNKNLTHFFVIFFSVNILGLGILLSLDRMPYIIFLFSIIILFILLKNYRIQLFIIFTLTVFVFQLFFNNLDSVKKRYIGLVRELELKKIAKLFTNNSSKSLISITKTNKDEDSLDSEYLKIYKTAYRVFLNKPYLGTGLKSFAYECEKLKIKNNENLSCSSHPHNIYLEILINQGILGLLLFLLFLITLIKKNYLNIIFFKITKEKKLLSFFFFTLLVSELIPFRSYGSIFQTVNGSIFWCLLAIISSKIHIKNK